MKVKIKVHPNSKNKKVIQNKDFLEVWLKEPAKDGKANKELIEAVSKYFSVPKSLICFIAGESSKIKILDIKIPPRA